MNQKQLDWIESSISKEERLEKEIQRLSEQCEKVRKGQYAKLTAIEKKYNDLRHDMDHIYSHICKNNLR